MNKGLHRAPLKGLIFSMLNESIPIILTFYMYIINMNRNNKIVISITRPGSESQTRKE